LLGEFQELQNQEIYFAPPDELNDPMEGFKDIHWRGDAIVWTNLLKHYLLCLMQFVLTAIERGPNHQFAHHDMPVLLTEGELATSSRSLFQGICAQFFENEEVAQLPALLAARTSSIRRNELFSLLFFLHFRALRVTCTAISPQEPLCLIDEFLRTKQDSPFRFQHYFAAQKALDEKHSNSADMAEEMNSRAASLVMQTILIRDYAGSSRHHGPAWNAISSAFPEVYVNQLERLLYCDWFTACFVAKPTHAAMWGNYGDGHRGVCLKFRTRSNAAGKPSLMLRTTVGAKGANGKITPISNDVSHELHEVRYAGRYVEIDFFRSMGRLTGPQLSFWFRGPKGEISSTGSDLIEGAQVWREMYWSNFYEALTTKLKDWQHESEYRIIFHGMMMEFPDKPSRKLHYRFKDLQGIIFGIKTPPEHKIEIMRIIGAKCRDEGRTDFEFYQAYYSRRTGRIETAQLSLLKFD
jgi:hypothetical protein